MSVIFPQNSKVKPAMWMCDPGIVAYSCARMGLPVPILFPIWEKVGTKAYDVSGHRIEGTMATNWQWVSSPYGSALKTGGVDNSYMQLNKESLFDGLTAFTFEFIIKWNATLSSDALISKRSAWSATGIPFEIQYNTHASYKFNFTVKGTDNRLHYFADPVVGQWYHLFFVWDGAAQKIYFGNQLKAQQACAVSITDNDTTVILATIPSGVESFNGEYAKIAFYYEGLSPFQIQTLCADPFGMFEPIINPAIWSIPAIGVTPTSVFYGPLGGSLAGPI